MPKIHFRFCASLFFGWVAHLLLALPATAGIFHADGGISTIGVLGFPPSYSLDRGDQAGGQVTHDDLGEHAQADSVADSYGVRAHSYAQLTGAGASSFIQSYELSSDANAEATFQDVTVSGPLGGMITTSINLNLDGSTVAGSSANGGAIAFANSSVGVQVYVNGELVGAGNHYDRQDTRFGPQTHSDGMLSSWGVASSGIATPSFSVQSGVPFDVRIRLLTIADTSSGNGYLGGISAEANAEFSHTFTFARNVPVFNLLSGYTADSAEAHIIDNHVAAVPEPSSLILLTAGMAAAFLAQRRRRLD